MARKKSKLNFLDSLLGGLAQGFQLSQQFKGDKQKSELDERKLSIQEQKLDLQQQQFDLDQEQRKKFQFLFGGAGQAPNRLPALNAPSSLVPVPSTLQAAPLATTGVTPTLPGIAEFPTELPAGGRVAPALPTAPTVQPGPDQIPFDTDTFAQPAQAPQVNVPQDQVIQQAQINEAQQRKAVDDWVNQIGFSLSNPKESTTVTANFGTAGSATKTFGKNATPNQHFQHFNATLNKTFPNITSAEKAQFLKRSSLLVVPAAKAFFDEKFNEDVNNEFLFLLEQRRQDNKDEGKKGRILTTERNELKSQAVNNTVGRYDGYVSKQHKGQFQKVDVKTFDFSEKLQAEIALTFTPEEFREAMRVDRKGLAEFLDKAITKIHGREVEKAEKQGVAVIEAQIKAGLKIPVKIDELNKIINPKTFTTFVAGTNYNTIKAAGGRPVSLIQRTKLADANSTLDTLRIISKLAKKLFIDQDLASRIQSAFGGSIQRFTQTDTDAILYTDLVRPVARTLAKAFGEDKITDLDVEDFVGLFPRFLPGAGEKFRIPDSKELAEKKLTAIENIMTNGRRRLIGLDPINPNEGLTLEEEAELRALENEFGR